MTSGYFFLHPHANLTYNRVRSFQAAVIESTDEHQKEMKAVRPLDRHKKPILPQQS
jgi:hypothetical protein